MSELVPIRKAETLPGVPTVEDWFDRFFDEVMPSRFFRRLMPSLWRESEQWMPAFDVCETKEQVIVKADLPGMKPENLDVSISSANVLTVRGEKKEEQEEKAEGYHRVERRFGSFSRTFALPCAVKAEEVEATYKDGVLRLSIPKTEASMSRKITIKIE